MKAREPVLCTPCWRGPNVSMPALTISEALPLRKAHYWPMRPATNARYVHRCQKKRNRALAPQEETPATLLHANHTLPQLTLPDVIPAIPRTSLQQRTAGLPEMSAFSSPHGASCWMPAAPPAGTLRCPSHLQQCGLGINRISAQGLNLYCVVLAAWKKGRRLVREACAIDCTIERTA